MSYFTSTINHVKKMQSISLFFHDSNRLPVLLEVPQMRQFESVMAFILIV